MANIAAEPLTVDVVACGTLADPVIGGEDAVDVPFRNAAGLGVGALAVRIKDAGNGCPGQVVPRELGHPCLVFAAAYRREGDVSDGCGFEDMLPDEDRPAVRLSCDEFRAVSVGPDGLRRVGCRLDGGLAPEAFKSETEAIDARGFNGLDGGSEGLRMEEIVLVGKHQVGGRDPGEGGVPRRPATAVRLIDDGYPVVLLRIALENGKRIVSRSVIDADAGPVLRGLADDAVEKRRQECRAIIDRYDKGDFAHATLPASARLSVM